VQVRSTIVRNLADLVDGFMVVKEFGCVEMKLAGKQHTHNQGMHPKLEPVFPPASHFADPALPED
jgi:hypothetical protein